MKTRFNSYDITCGVAELQKLVGLRVNQVYDVDNKTYLIRLQGGGEAKMTLLIESGIRFHTTSFEWPKNVAPSGFSMKLRKHLKNKRLEKFQQLGVDRIVDFQFGIGEAAYHIIVELYDRGNIILTDHELTILYILRPHTEGDKVRFAMREKYPISRAKEHANIPNEDELRQMLALPSTGDNLRRFLMTFLDCGPAVIDHVLIEAKLDDRIIKCTLPVEDENTEKDAKGNANKKSQKQRKKDNNRGRTTVLDIEKDMPQLQKAIQNANELMSLAREGPVKGFIIQKMEEKPAPDGENVEHFYQNIEFHPYFFAQFKNQPNSVFETFMQAVDEFFSRLEGQKIDLKALQQERDALKKLSNVKKDHVKRLEELNKVQEDDKQKAELITSNQELVDKAILAVQSAIASQLSWPDIHELVKEAQTNGDPVALTIKQLKLEINHVSLLLKDPYYVADDENDGDEPVSLVVDVDLGLSAWANARRYYDQKRSAAQKEQKTIDASQKALKSAERKTQQTLKDVRTISTIAKVRKVYWFEKFYWFISSENYLVIGGRDAQQNELIVKRYMRATDIYVHAEIQGASSVIIRNPSGGDIPPKTLLEAGTMAISYSVAWDAKVVTNAYWVRSEQVSKTAPTGEFLGTGSFMVRGKKNFLPSCHLIMGLSILFKLEDSFIEKHRGERKVRTFDDENLDQAEQQIQHLIIENEKLEALDECVELELDNAEQAPEGVNNTDGEEKHDASAFPDTQVKIEHDTGRVTVRTTSTNESESAVVVEKNESNVEDTTIIAAAPSRIKQQKNAKKRKDGKDRKAHNEIQQKQQQNLELATTKNCSQMKRGQKGKLKKIKSKYKDQDDEERELRMMILNPSGKDKTGSNNIKPGDEDIAESKPKRVFERKPLQSNPAADGEDDEVPANADVEMLDSLTGQPYDDDELLFAIPIVAPYQALQNYKFKVKLTPGTGKRGRAAKTAVTMFSKDKNCGSREKDLLKSIKEETLARNIPGKVKISAPQLQKFKK